MLKKFDDEYIRKIKIVYDCCTKKYTCHDFLRSHG